MGVMSIKALAKFPDRISYIEDATIYLDTHAQSLLEPKQIFKLIMQTSVQAGNDTRDV